MTEARSSRATSNNLKIDRDRPTTMMMTIVAYNEDDYMLWTTILLSFVCQVNIVIVIIIMTITNNEAPFVPLGGKLDVAF